ncbi:uncharacterized protein [Dendropsophus ebraccatus]|uniref:uncharacterized protein n=1 Tax=Dendropsophus ebraccatus TaxID=150705 RepID=UPI00383113FD
MEAESAELSESTPARIQAPVEGTTKKSHAKSRDCPVCRKRLSSSYTKVLCGSCMNRVLEEQGPSFMRNMKNMIKKEIRASMPSQTPATTTASPPELTPAPVSQLPLATPIPPTIEVEQSVHSQPPSTLGDDEDLSLGIDEPEAGPSNVESLEEEVATPLPSADYIESLIKAVRETMGIVEVPETNTIQDRMFGGLAPKKRLVFPIHQNIKALIKHEWSNPDRKFFVPAAFKRKYPFDHEESNSWGFAPKIDPPVAKITKLNALPFEDCATLKDPMDKRAEIYLKKDWEASTALFKPLVAATSVSRSLGVPVGGRLSLFWSQWCGISNSSFVLDTIKHGLKISFVSSPGERFVITDLSSDPIKQTALSTEVQSLLRKKVLVPVPETECDSQISLLVEGKGASIQGTSLDSGQHFDHHHRCQSQGVGSPYRHTSIPGPVVPRGGQGPTKRERIESNILLLVPGSSVNKRQKRENTNRQQIGSGVHQPPRRHKISTTYESCPLHVQASTVTLSVPLGTSPEGGRQCEGRFSKQTLPKPGGLGALPGGISTDMQNVGITGDRPLRIAEEQKDPGVLFPMSCRQAQGSRCTSPALGQRPTVRIPTHQTNPKSSQKDQAGQGPHNSNSALLAKKGVVYLAQEDVSDRPMDSSGQGRSPRPGPSISPSGSKPSPDGMAVERQLLIDRGLSSEVITTLLASRKKVTSTIYLRTWIAFCKFVNKPVNVLTPPDIPLILQFLQEGLNKHLRPSTIKGKTKGKSASTQTIARWVKQAVGECYRVKNMTPPVGFGAHSTRAVATSWAERAAVSIDQICRAATWNIPEALFGDGFIQSLTKDLLEAIQLREQKLVITKYMDWTIKEKIELTSKEFVPLPLGHLNAFYSFHLKSSPLAGMEVASYTDSYLMTDRCGG